MGRKQEFHKERPSAGIFKPRKARVGTSVRESHLQVVSKKINKRLRGRNTKERGTTSVIAVSVPQCIIKYQGMCTPDDDVGFRLLEI